MTTQEGVIHYIALFGTLVLVSVLLLTYSVKRNGDLFIEPPFLFALSVYLDTIEGKKLVHTETFGAVNEAAKEDLLSNINSVLESRNSFFEGAVISLQPNEIYFFDKTTRTLRMLTLPKQIENLKNEDPELLGLQFFAEELNSNYYLVNFSYNQKDHFTYLLDVARMELSHLQQFDDECKYIFCGGPEILKRLSVDDFVLIQGAGDACWSAGVVHAFNPKVKKATKLFNYSNGCSSEFDSYFDMYGDSFIRGKHRVLDTYNGGGGPDQEILTIYLTDLGGLKKDLLGAERMPAKIDYLSFNKDNNTLYLHSNFNKKYYQYDLKKDTLIAIPRENITESSSIDRGSDSVSGESKDFLIYEVVKKDLQGIEEVYTNGQSLGIKDTSGTGISLLGEPFLGRVKFEKENLENCPYISSPSLQDKKYPFRFASHEFEESARIVSREGIEFVVTSTCIEYASEKATKSEQFLGVKKFILNIKTGKVGEVKLKHRLE